MAKKKVAKKVEEKRSALTELEMVKMDLNNTKVKAKELEILAVQQKEKLVVAEIATKMEKLHQELARLKDERKKFNDNIKEELEIASETWGFDPVTGEIKDE